MQFSKYRLTPETVWRAHPTQAGCSILYPLQTTNRIGITASEKTITVVEVRCHKGMH